MLTVVMSMTANVSPAPRSAPPKMMAAAKPDWQKPVIRRHLAGQVAHLRVLGDHARRGTARRG